MGFNECEGWSYTDLGITGVQVVEKTKGAGENGQGE